MAFTELYVSRLVDAQRDDQEKITWLERNGAAMPDVPPEAQPNPIKPDPAPAVATGITGITKRQLWPAFVYLERGKEVEVYYSYSESTAIPSPMPSTASTRLVSGVG